MTKFTLSILIPTYNRCSRLKKSLEDLFCILNKFEGNEKIEIVISDNGSEDETVKVLKKYNLKFLNIGIIFKYSISEKNQGFDVNVAKCVKISSGKYLWFLSDDDNIIGESLLTILEDIKDRTPSAIVYNFNQHPFDYSNPLIKKDIHYLNFKDAVNQTLSKVLMWPKLSTIIIRRDIECLNIVEKVALDNPGFMHIALLIQSLIKYQGGIYQKKDFIAEPDHDYMNNIDFMPNIGDNIVGLFSNIMKINNINLSEYAIKLEKRNPSDVTIDCIYWVSEYYRGRMSFKIEVLNELKAYILSHLCEKNYLSLTALIRPSMYYFYCRLINGYFYVVHGIKLNKIRK